jgi:hypothetical protein
MNPVFSHLDVFDPNAQSRMPLGHTYGRDRSFMVRRAKDTASILDVLARDYADLNFEGAAAILNAAQSGAPEKGAGFTEDGA